MALAEEKARLASEFLVKKKGVAQDVAGSLTLILILVQLIYFTVQLFRMCFGPDEAARHAKQPGRVMKLAVRRAIRKTMRESPDAKEELLKLGPHVEAAMYELGKTITPEEMAILYKEAPKRAE